MKKARWIWLFLVLIIVISIGSVTVKYWNSISALVNSFRYSQEEVIEKINKNKTDLQETIDKNENITVRDLTDEEAELLNSGEITEEEAVKILTGKKPEAEQTQDKPQKQNPDAEPKEPDSSENKASIAVSEAIAKLYIQKSKYLGKLDEIEASVRQGYIDMVNSNKMTAEEKKAAKQQFLKSNISMVAGWEKECDSIVYGIIDEIKLALKETGQPDNITQKLKEAYLNEKSAKKTYFINRYMD